MKSKADELEQRVRLAHDRYMQTKDKTLQPRKVTRCVSERVPEDAYLSGKNSVHSQLNNRRNKTSKFANRKGSKDSARSNTSSHAFLHLSKDLENIYKEFEAGEVNELNKLRRLVSHFRGLSKRTLVQMNDLKTTTTKEIASLKDQYQTERKKRIKVQEEKLERQAQLMQDIADKDSTIFALNK